MKKHLGYYLQSFYYQAAHYNLLLYPQGDRSDMRMPKKWTLITATISVHLPKSVWIDLMIQIEFELFL